MAHLLWHAAIYDEDGTGSLEEDEFAQVSAHGLKLPRCMRHWKPGGLPVISPWWSPLATSLSVCASLLAALMFGACLTEAWDGPQHLPQVILFGVGVGLLALACLVLALDHLDRSLSWILAHSICLNHCIAEALVVGYAIQAGDLVCLAMMSGYLDWSLGWHVGLQPSAFLC
eukprot:scaffold170415_cov20-Tisochrysis_lutea.AAC.1